MQADLGPIEARAKINLYLHVTGRRDDGFHELDSL
ncbi:MAG: 4-(cytidine 5'-diphospho)-2-C-methyl-D-erythritol kinase, partial [Alphaproteobacteria bacterium]